MGHKSKIYMRVRRDYAVSHVVLRSVEKLNATESKYQWVSIILLIYVAQGNTINVALHSGVLWLYPDDNCHGHAEVQGVRVERILA